jgi:Co/Zn/Cd efflux system component
LALKKSGDLAAFTRAIALAMIALLIGYESVDRLASPVPISRYGVTDFSC